MTVPKTPFTNNSSDGYTSLLIEEEGGVAKEIVSEENGVLISTILRQYFMSLKVMGKWKRWGESMNNKFNSIQTNLQKNHGHAFHDPSPRSPDKSTPAQHPSISRVVEQSSPPDSSESSDPDADEDEDDGPLIVEDKSKPIKFSDHQIEMIRRALEREVKDPNKKAGSAKGTVDRLLDRF